MFQSICSRAADRSMETKRYWIDSSNIVAAVSAYEHTMYLPTGEAIPYFSTNVLCRYTNQYAVVFYVVAPKKFAGKFFRLVESEPLVLDSDYPSPIYRMGKLYCFRLLDDPNPSPSDMTYWFGLTPEDLVSIPVSSNGRLSVAKTNSSIYYLSIGDAVAALQAVESERAELEAELNNLSNQVENVKAEGIDIQKDPRYRQLRGAYFDLFNRLPNYNLRQQEIKQQIEKLRQLEEGRGT
jgi:hypothetical protein